MVAAISKIDGSSTFQARHDRSGARDSWRDALPQKAQDDRSPRSQAWTPHHRAAATDKTDPVKSDGKLHGFDPIDTSKYGDGRIVGSNEDSGRPKDANGDVLHPKDPINPNKYGNGQRPSTKGHNRHDHHARQHPSIYKFADHDGRKNEHDDLRRYDPINLSKDWRRQVEVPYDQSSKNKV